MAIPMCSTRVRISPFSIWQEGDFFILRAWERLFQCIVARFESHHTRFVMRVTSLCYAPGESDSTVWYLDSNLTMLDLSGRRLLYVTVLEKSIPVCGIQVRILPWSFCQGGNFFMLRAWGRRFQCVAPLKANPQLHTSLVSDIVKRNYLGTSNDCASTKSQSIVPEGLSVPVLFWPVITPDNALYPRDCNYGPHGMVIVGLCVC